MGPKKQNKANGQRAWILFPGQAPLTKPSTPPGSVNLVAASKQWLITLEDCGGIRGR